MRKTSWFSLEVGLRQGCILSPTLFTIFIDSLARKVKEIGGGANYKYSRNNNIEVSLLLFADDIVLMAESEQALQNMLRVVSEESRKYRFKFNKDKSNVMIFGTGKIPSQKFYLGEEELKIVDSYKYLGLWIDKNFTWKQHVEI